MADPISLTLAAAAFIEPAIRATYQAYSLLRLSRSFGPDFKTYCRKLDGQKARLEELSQWPVGNLLQAENDMLVKVIIAELAAMQENLANCAAIRSKYETESWAEKNGGEKSTENGKKSKFRNWRRTSADGILGSQVRPEKDSQVLQDNLSSSISFDSRSDESNETAITSIHDPLVDTKSVRSCSDAIIQEVAGQQRRAANSMQSSTSFRQRAMWIAKDREEYKSSVGAITKSNDLIENLVRARALQFLQSKEVERTHAGSETRKTGKAAPVLPPLPADERSCIKVLTRLHGALIQSRTSKEGEATAKSLFGMKASLNHTLTKESLLMDFEELPFRKNSQIYLLQALKPSEADKSTFLLAESLIEPVPTQMISQVPENDLDPFIHVGDFGAASSDIHRLYRDPTSWAPIMSLQDLIGSMEKPPSPPVRFRLAALLAMTHLHSTGLSYTPGQLHPVNFKYFDISSEATSVTPREVLNDEERLLNLYYFSGLGSVRPKNSTRRIGALRGTTPVFDVATTELGLLLYQVGSWQRLEYSKVNSTTALENLRGVVRQRVHELHREAGLRYAETVERCLDWRHKAAKEREIELPRLYEEIVKTLKDLDEEFRVGRFDVMSSYNDHESSVGGETTKVVSPSAIVEDAVSLVQRKMKKCTRKFV